jgi:hypothetical protein
MSKVLKIEKRGSFCVSLCPAVKENEGETVRVGSRWCVMKCPHCLTANSSRVRCDWKDAKEAK